MAIGDSEARRLAQQLKYIDTGHSSTKKFSVRVSKPKKIVSPSPPVDAEDRVADASFGLVVTQLQDMQQHLSSRVPTPAATSCAAESTFQYPSEAQGYQSSLGCTGGDIISNMLQCISEGSPSVSPRMHHAPAFLGSKTHPSAAAGTLFPFSKGWGALHPPVEVKQRPAVLRSAATDSGSTQVAAQRWARRFFSGHVCEKSYVLAKRSLEAAMSLRRDFPEIKLQTSVAVPPFPMELCRQQGPTLNPNFRSAFNINNEWHVQKVPVPEFFAPSVDDCPPSPYEAILEQATPTHAQDAGIDDHDARVVQHAAHTRVQHARLDDTVELAKNALSPFEAEIESVSGGITMGADAFDFDSPCELPPIRNAGQRLHSSRAKKIHRVSSHGAMHLAKVVIGVPMSNAGHDLLVNRWVHSQAVVAKQYSHVRHELGPTAIPPLQRVSPTTFRKSLNHAPPSRVLSPDPQPAGNIMTAINISAAQFSKLSSTAMSPAKSSSVTQRPLRVNNKKVERLQVDDDAIVTSLDETSRSTPSPPPVLMRLGGIVSGGKNVFIGEKSERNTNADHFGRSNTFNK